MIPTAPTRITLRTSGTAPQRRFPAIMFPTRTIPFETSLMALHETYSEKSLAKSVCLRYNTHARESGVWTGTESASRLKARTMDTARPGRFLPKGGRPVPDSGRESGRAVHAKQGGTAKQTSSLR